MFSLPLGWAWQLQPGVSYWIELKIRPDPWASIALIVLANVLILLLGRVHQPGHTHTK